LSSSVFATVFYPLHRVKILLQTQDSNPLITSGQASRTSAADMCAVPRLVREGGVRELWRGNGAYMLRHVPSTTLSFAFKDALLRALPHYDAFEDLGKAALVNLAAGFIGGAAALFFVYPLDFATIRMAAELRQSKKRLGVMDTLNSTQRSGGLTALYRGFGVSAAAIGAYKALYFGLYDTACAAMEQASLRAEMDMAGRGDRWAAANLVVVTASSLTYPLDVVRKRLVADTALGPGRQQYKGFFDCVFKMARTEGLGGFYRFYAYDMMLRLGGGVLLVLYDELK
ncbi:ADP/ATP carrier protein, probably mitochondrial, partial [Volvox carteri f. nagariensis]